MSDGTIEIAAFDLDGTVIRGQSGVAWVWHLAARRLVPTRVALRVAWLLLRYRRGDVLDYDRLAAEFLGPFRGAPIDRFESLLDRFVDDRLLPQIRRDARVEMRRLADQGHHVVVASAALSPIVERVVARLPVDGWMATHLAPPYDGRFAGKLAGPVCQGPAKLAALRAYADCRFKRWQLTHAFTDHETDSVLLEAARWPVAVNPSTGLRRLARLRDWPIAVWR